MSFEKPLSKILRLFTTLSLNKKSWFYNFSKSTFFVSYYQISSHEVENNIIKTFYINDEIENTLFN